MTGLPSDRPGPPRRSARRATRRGAGMVAGLVAGLAAVAPLAACGSGGATGGPTTITVLAAASLTDAFTELARRFEAAHPGTDVRLALDSSATLARQALDGAPGDVLATADTATMRTARPALAADPTVFATNTMVLVTPAGNPAGLTGLGDLDDGDVTYVVCVPTAPCGKVAATLLRRNAVTADPASQEVDVRSVLARVTSDEADAGLVYTTDATAAGDAVTRLPVPGSRDAVTSYPIAPLQQSRHAGLAGRFVDLVVSEAGQRVLRSAGFGPP